MIIDMHTHWAPRGLLRAASEGGDWYGWKLVYEKSGSAHEAFRDVISPVGGAHATLDAPLERSEARFKEQGVTVQALMPLATYWFTNQDPTIAAAFCRELNEEVAEVQKSYPDQYRGMAVLPLEDEYSALRELEHAASQLSLSTIAIPSNIRGRNLDDPAVVRVLEEAAKMGLSICVHPPRFGTIGAERLPRYFFRNSFGAPFESAVAVMSIIYSGVLDRYPEVKIMFTQGGGWIHFGIGRFDLRYRQGREDARKVDRLPSEYLKLLYYDCLVHDDEALALLLRRVGSDRVMIGTDFPATGDIEGGSPNWIKSRDFIDDHDKDNILWRNARSFLGI